MNFKQWLLSEDIYPNNTAVVFHRTCPKCDEKQSVKSVSNILTSNFKAGSGCMYGCGLYTTLNLESQFKDYMSTYGYAVIKFKVTDLDKYLIFQLSTAKQIHGENYKISDQLKKLGVINQVTELTKRHLDEYDKRQEQEIYSSTMAKNFYEYNKWIANSIKGIIYRGENDGYCLLKYEPVNDGTISMLGYAVASPDDFEKMRELQANKGWITSTEKAKIKQIYDLPVDRKLQYDNKAMDKAMDKSSSKSFLDKILKLSPKSYEYLGKKYEKVIDNLDDSDVEYLFEYLLYRSENKDEVAKLIINYKKELSDSNVYILTKNANDIDHIAKLIINKKPKLSDRDVCNLIRYSTEKIAEIIINKQPELFDKNFKDFIISARDRGKMAELIINNKPELSQDNVFNLLNYLYFDYAKCIDHIAELLQKDTDNISKLSVDNIRELFESKSKEYKNKLAQILNKYHQNKTPEIQELIDKYLNIRTFLKVKVKNIKIN